MITVFCPGLIVSYLNRLYMFQHVKGCETIINMIWFVFMPVHIKCRVLFFALQLTEIFVISAKNTFGFQPLNDCGMIAFPPWFIPYCITVEITSEYSLLPCNNSII